MYQFLCISFWSLQGFLKRLLPFEWQLAYQSPSSLPVWSCINRAVGWSYCCIHSPEDCIVPFDAHSLPILPRLRSLPHTPALNLPSFGIWKAWSSLLGRSGIQLIFIDLLSSFHSCLAWHSRCYLRFPPHCRSPCQRSDPKSSHRFPLKSFIMCFYPFGSSLWFHRSVECFPAWSSWVIQCVAFNSGTLPQ